MFGTQGLLFPFRGGVLLRLAKGLTRFAVGAILEFPEAQLKEHNQAAIAPLRESAPPAAWPPHFEAANE